MKAIDLILQIIMASLNPCWNKSGDRFIFFYLDLSCEYLVQNSQKGKRSISKMLKSSDRPFIAVVGTPVMVSLSSLWS